MSEDREPVVPVADAAPAAEPAAAPVVAPEAPPAVAVAPAAADKPAPEAPPALEGLLSGASEKPGDAAASAVIEPTTPAPYDWQPFALPDDLKGIELDEGRVGTLREIVTAPDLTPQDRAQQLLDLYIAERRAYDEKALERQIGVFQDTQRQWIDLFKGDQEIGGAAAQTHLKLANDFINRFASRDQMQGKPLPALERQPEQTDEQYAEARDARASDHNFLMTGLRVMGAVNHPEIVRLFSRAEARIQHLEALLSEPARAAPAIGPSAVPRDIGNRRPSTQGGNPGRGQVRMRDMYDNPRSQEVFNGGGGR